MSTATWGELDTSANEMYPTNLLKYFLYQMMVQFSANGACLALYDESKTQMEVRLHVRLRNASLSSRSGSPSEEEHMSQRRATIDLSLVDQSSSSPKGKRVMQAVLELEDVTPQQSELFPVGTDYPIGQDLIGYVWRYNEANIMRHDGYLASFPSGQQAPLRMDVTPLWYLAAPIQEVTLSDEARGKRQRPRMFGVVVLYQTLPGSGGFHLKQRGEAINFTDRIALHLQNERQRWHRQRSSEYLQKLQDISTSFPTTVKLGTLVENIYRFASEVVDVNSMLITLYDRDTKKMYEIFAVNNRHIVKGLPENPTILTPESRPVWTQVALEKKTRLLLEPMNPESNGNGMYDELLYGIWGDQRRAESFLLLPMKMFTRVIGTISITSKQPHAYQPEEIQVLETMAQIVTVSIENAKLYERSHSALRAAKEREELLAALNSALQSIGSVLNVNELLGKIVRAVTTLFQEEMCVFFQLSPDETELAARAAYAPSKLWQDGEGLPDPANLPHSDEQHIELIERIRIPFKGTMLEQQVNKESFFYIDANVADELASKSSEGGAIFLRETGIENMLMVPVLYHTELVGILAMHMPMQNHVFSPQEVGVLLAIAAQAGSAIRSAQMFEKIQENNAELERMNSLKDEFLVTASHELRTPLSAISGYSTLLKRQSNRIDAEHILRFATKIAGAAQQLADLLANMTEAAKMGTADKKLLLHCDPVHLSSLVNSVASILSINIEQKVSVLIEPSLWVCGDPLPIRQVITNLLDNAAKYSPPDGRIEVLANASTLAQVQLPAFLVDHEDFFEHSNDPVVVVHVHDEGEGINPEEQQKIFEKFVRATRSLTTPVRGSGLGLYICRRYIEAMGGKLWLEQSVPGEGSVFSFYLPRAMNPPLQPNEESPLREG